MSLVANNSFTILIKIFPYIDIVLIAKCMHKVGVEVNERHIHMHQIKLNQETVRVFREYPDKGQMRLEQKDNLIA